MHWRREASWVDRARWGASSAVGGSLGALARDVTETTARRSCLVIAPHPDDETLGCGATLARKVEAGTPAHVLVVSDGATWPPDVDPADNVATRDAELRRATAVLGVPEEAVTHLMFPETRLAEVSESLSDAVADAVRELGPDDVFLTSTSDPHHDHAALGLAARRALTGSPTRLVVYGIWQWEHPRSWLRTLRDSSRPEAVATTGYLDRKRAALAEYRSQLAMTRADDSEHTVSSLLLRHFLGRREVFFPLRPGTPGDA